MRPAKSCGITLGVRCQSADYLLISSALSRECWIHLVLLVNCRGVTVCMLLLLNVGWRS